MLPLRVPVRKASQVKLVSCRIHNLIIDYTGHATVQSNEPADVSGAVMEGHLQDYYMDMQGRLRDREESNLRDSFTNFLSEIGFEWLT